MTLKHIATETCPDCGARAVMDRQNSQHVNGEFDEIREFTCGLRLHFVPNFNRIDTEWPCGESRTAKARIRKRHDAVLQIKELIESLKLDDLFEQNLLRAIDTTPGWRQ